jgi:DNA-binding helix-hairpin-helix protein with protein kinase domain
MQVLRCSPRKEILSLNVSLGRGGEACVYAVPSDNDFVAKIYHKPTTAHAEKLQAMLANPPENPTASLGHISIAWPEDLLRAADGKNSILGFLMPRIQGMRPIIDFYNPRTRRQHCPLFNYQYLLRTARNLAAAFAALHASGYCIGDVNESNILVSDTALVTLDRHRLFPSNRPKQQCCLSLPSR